MKNAQRFDYACKATCHTTTPHLMFPVIGTLDVQAPHEEMLVGLRHEAVVCLSQEAQQRKRTDALVLFSGKEEGNGGLQSDLQVAVHLRDRHAAESLNKLPTGFEGRAVAIEGSAVALGFGHLGQEARNRNLPGRLDIQTVVVASQQQAHPLQGIREKAKTCRQSLSTFRWQGQRNKDQYGITSEFVLVRQERNQQCMFGSRGSVEAEFHAEVLERKGLAVRPQRSTQT